MTETIKALTELRQEVKHRASFETSFEIKNVFKRIEFIIDNKIAEVNKKNSHLKTK